MPATTRRKSTSRKTASARRPGVKSSAMLGPKRIDDELVNRIGAAASCDLAARSIADDASEAALVNAIARAAARSLVS